VRRALTFYGSTVGKKVAMALSGLILFGFVIGHMLGNLKAFEPWSGEGPHPIDSYGAALRELGYPFLPEYGALWIARIALLAALAFHAIPAFQLWRQSRVARGAGYRKEDSQVFSYASRTMRWGGVIILLFVVYHLLHMTTGDVHPDFEYGAVYANLVAGFQNPAVAGVYLIAVGALALHLYHGVWSLFGTLGVDSPRVERIRRPLALVSSVGLFVGYVAVPVAIVLGILS
jgi:succinate dehydrogenase / fumarate reductase, cytochrome b subunit